MTTAVLPDDLVDLLSPDAVRDPYAYFGRYRAISPVIWNPKWKGWIFTGNEVVREGLAGDTMTSDRIARFESQLTSRSGDDDGAGIVYRTISQWLVYASPPRHTDLRRILSKPFSPRAVKDLRAMTEGIVERLLDEVERTARDGGGHVDVLHDFASHVPASVISRMMGIPDEDVAKIGHWSEELTLLILGALGSDDRYERAKAAFVELEAYVRELVAARRRQPGEDVVSLMTGARDAEGGLTEAELIASLILFIFGGHETTMNLIASSLLALDRHPDARDMLLAGDVTPAAAIEELLRYDGPTRSILRDVARDHEVCGQSLKAGQRALFVLAAANHDPAAFDDPDALKLDRAPNRHIAFGTGIHQCMGSPLARLEAQIAIPAFVRRFPGYRLSAPVEWQPLLMTRGVKALPVEIAA